MPSCRGTTESELPPIVEGLSPVLWGPVRTGGAGVHHSTSREQRRYWEGGVVAYGDTQRAGAEDTRRESAHGPHQIRTADRQCGERPPQIGRASCRERV